MSQITTGLRSILDHPVLYETLQNVMGTRSLRRHLFSSLVKPQPGQCILDIGCGTGSITQFVPPGATYFGYDISERYISHAKTRYSARGTFSARIFSSKEIHLLPPIDTVLALGLLHHLSDEECISLFQLARSVLKAGGKLISLDGCYTEKQNPLARFIINRDRGQNVRTQKSYEKLAGSAFKSVDSYVLNRAWIPYTYCIMECSGAGGG